MYHNITEKFIVIKWFGIFRSMLINFMLGQTVFCSASALHFGDRRLNKTASLVPLKLKYLFYLQSDTRHGDGTYPLRDILVDLVNKNDSILPSYNVSVETIDTKFNTNDNVGITIQLFMQNIAKSAERPAILINKTQCEDSCYGLAAEVNFDLDDFHPTPLFFGPEYSSEAKVIGQVAPLYNLVQIGSTPNAPALSDRTKYPNMFRTCMSSNEFVNIPRALMNYFNYTRTALVSFDDTYATEPMQKIDYDLRTHNINVVFNVKYRPSRNETVDQVLQSIALYDARIIFLWSGNAEDYRLFCRAMRTDENEDKIKADRHLFIFLGLDDPTTVIEPQQAMMDKSSCTPERLARLLNGSLLVLSPKWGPLGDQLDFGLTNSELILQAESLGRTKYGDQTGRLNQYAPLMIDAFWLGFLALDAVDRRLRAEVPPRTLFDFTFASRDIANMLKEEIQKTRFLGAGGKIAFDTSGNIMGRILIQQYQPGASGGSFVDKFHVVNQNNIKLISHPIFNTQNGQSPSDGTPSAHDKPLDPAVIIVACCAAVVCIVLLGAIVLYINKLKVQAAQLAHPTWLIDPCTVVMKDASFSIMSLMRQSLLSMDGASRLTATPTTKKTAFLDDQIVYVQLLPSHASRLQVDLFTHKTLSAFRDNLLHVNMVRFIGYCLQSDVSTKNDAHSREQYLMWEYGEKGSLEQLVENDAMKLDATFEFAIMLDTAQGMAYLHKSFVGTHGALCAAACVIDRRFSIKIAGYGDALLAPLFGCQSLTIEEESGDVGVTRRCKSLYSEKRLYWSPELLRSSQKVATRAADIYAYGITVYVLLTRAAPFESSCLPSNEIVQLVRQTDRQPQPFRPELQLQELAQCDRRLSDLIRLCWAEQPNERPQFADIVLQLSTISGVKSSNSSITDQLLKRLERYAIDMESLVHDRTRELESEKRRSDELLNAMLPLEIANELKLSGQVQPESFDSVSLYFSSDIVGFTQLSSSSTPIEIVNLLNELYTMFDSQIDLFDAYKVETIGDAYMVVSGLPRRNGLQHVSEIGRLALALLSAIRTFVIPHRREEKLMLRVGLHTGPCVAGVVGIKMPRYCLFGDTVNTTSRMESTGKAFRIHISDTMKQAFDIIGGFATKQRGPLNVKGKGIMLTHWLVAYINDEYSNDDQ